MIRNYGLVICEFLMFSILGLHFAHSQDLRRFSKVTHLRSLK